MNTMKVETRKRKRPIRDHFWDNTRKDGDCLVWTAGMAGNGYGSMWDGKRVVNAHQFAWLLTGGTIPLGHLLCHRCDNRACVNPSHLFLGTQKDNIADMMKKGRRQDSSGEKCSRAKLGVQDVLAIRAARAAGVSGPTLAKTYGVTVASIYAAARGLSWKKLTRK